jgi:superfamily I DNA/RNA helicase
LDKDEPPAENIIPFSTVHSSKGLESDLVVMADIGEPAKRGDGFLSPLYYVGVSRARVMLVLSISAAMRRDYADLEVS